MNEAYWPIDRVQKRMKKAIVAIAKEFAVRGRTLRDMAGELGLNYSSLKRALRLRGYQHPVGLGLVSCKLQTESNVSLDDYLTAMISKGESRNAIAKDLGVDNKTLQSYADRKGYNFPTVKPIPKDFTNIIAANKNRKYKRCPIIELGMQKGIPCSTVRKRIALGWNIEEAITIPQGDGHLRRRTLKIGDVVTYVGKYSKTLRCGERVKIVGGTREARLEVESLNNSMRHSFVLRNNVAIVTDLYQPNLVEKTMRSK